MRQARPVLSLSQERLSTWRQFATIPPKLKGARRIRVWNVFTNRSRSIALVVCGRNLRKTLSYLRRAVGIVELKTPTVVLGDSDTSLHRRPILKVRSQA